MIPPYIHEEVMRRGTEAQREEARRQLRIGLMLRARRHMLHPGHGLVETFDRTPGQRTRRTYDAQGTEREPSTVARGEHDPPVDGHPEVNEAHDGAGHTWDFLRNYLTRDSLDDRGMVLESITDWGVMDNAFWDGVRITYGRGSLFERFTKDPTVCGHELGHGLIQFTSQWVYQGEPGAINEHVADVLGSLVEQWSLGQDVEAADWLVGRELISSRLSARALRDMVSPGTAYDDPLLGRDPQPNHYANRYTGMQDNGGVHINSGIANRAYALAAKRLGGFAWDHVGALWLGHVLADRRGSPMTTFRQFASLTYVVAQERYTKDIAEAVKYGWSEVGIVVGDATPPPPDDEPSPLGCPPEIRDALVRLSTNPDVKKLMAWGRALSR